MKEELVADVHFIFEECVRLQKYLPDRMHDIPKDDFFFHMPHPSGSGDLICGRAAFQKLEALSKFAAKRSRLENRISVGTILRPLSKILVRRFITERQELSDEYVERALSEAARWAKRKCERRVHFVPCHLMYSQEPLEFRIGPVLLRSRRSFRKRIQEKLREEKPDRPLTEDRKLTRTLIAQALNYYRAFGWVAEVQIENCDSETSQTLAVQSATAALDCLHLMLGARHSKKMKVGGPRLSTDRRARLYLSSEDRIGPSVSFGGPGEVGFMEGWSAILDRPDYKQLLDLCGIAIECATNPDLERPICHRFLDAARWFGQATREESRSAAVVKYVTALERMLMTEEKDDISRTMSERLSSVCFLGLGQKSIEEWAIDAISAYDVRSKLVHGSMRPDDPHISEILGLCMHLGESALLSTITLLGDEALRAEKSNSKRLANWFDRIITFAKAEEANRLVEASGATKS